MSGQTGNTTSLTNCLAWSETGDNYGFYLSQCDMNNLAFHACSNSLTSCGGSMSPSLFDSGVVGPWPLQERLESESGEDVTSLYISPSLIWYASPSGTGSGLSQVDPMSVKSLLRTCSPGDTLILLDGLYQGADNMIVPPVSVSGRSDAYVTLKAQNPGQAVIDGQNLRIPVDLKSSLAYWNIEGLSACGSSGAVVKMYGCTNLNLREITAHDSNGTSDSDALIYDIYQCQNIMLERCAGWGRANMIYRVMTNSSQIKMRYCFGRFEGGTATGNKSVYNSNGTTAGLELENCVGLFAPVTAVPTGMHGVFFTDGQNVKLTNCVGRNRTPVITSTRLYSMGNTNTNCLISLENCLAHSETSGVTGFNLTKCRIKNLTPKSCGIVISGCCDDGNHYNFDSTVIGVWPLQDRIINEAQENVTALYTASI
jgi:hypothetical protein